MVVPVALYLLAIPFGRGAIGQGDLKLLVSVGLFAGSGRLFDALDNALAESLIGLYKTELIKPRGPWHNIREVDVATAAWVDWYNNRRLHGACQGRPPVEFETLYELGDLISLVA